MSSGRWVQVVPGVMVSTDAPETEEEYKRERRIKRERDAAKLARMVAFSKEMTDLGAEMSVEKETPVATFYLDRGFKVKVAEDWAYFRVGITPGLTVEVGERVNNTPYEGDEGTKYSGDEKKLGSVCRAAGFAGGLFDEHFRSFCKNGLYSWHVDVRSALPLLLAAIKKETL